MLTCQSTQQCLLSADLYSVLDPSYNFTNVIQKKVHPVYNISFNHVLNKAVNMFIPAAQLDILIWDLLGISFAVSLK